MNIKLAVRKAARRLGYDICPYRPSVHPLARRMRLLALAGIDEVFDVGANVGQFGAELRDLGYRGRIVSFEPCSAPFEVLSRAAAKDGNWIACRTAVGGADVEGAISINLSGNSESSSLLAMLPRHSESAPESAFVGSETVPLASLRGLLSRFKTPNSRLLLKLDVQGYEGQILASAPESLREIAGVHLEMSLVPLYQGSSLAEQLMALLRGAGFVPVGIEPDFADPRTGQLLQCDGLFLRPEVLPRSS